MTTRKRASGSAYRLRQPSSSGLQPQERRAKEWNGNILGATNDSADYKPAVSIVGGYPIEYSCRKDPRNKEIKTKDVKIMAIAFDYEMITSKDTNIGGSIRSLEWSLLWNVARNLGLHTCNFRDQNASGIEKFDDIQNRRSLSGFSGDYIVGLSSLDFDYVDSDNDFCQLISTEKNDNENACTPIVGKMTAQYMGDEKLMRDYLTQIVAKELDSKRVHIEKVKETRYVGDRSKLAVNGNTRESFDTSNSNTNVALVVGALAGVVVLSIVLFMARGRRRRQQQQSPVLVEEDDEEIAGSIPSMVLNRHNHDAEPSVATTEDRSTLAVKDTDDEIDTANENNIGEPLISGSTMITGQSLLSGQSPIDSEAPATDADVDHANAGTKTDPEIVSGETGETEQNEMTSTDTHDNSPKEKSGFPPRPVVAVVPVDEKKEKELVKSKTLQPRRKRRKKKKQKQRVLKRVSSRNSIDEMETIQEQDEDIDIDADNESEFDGSEYSTDDEDDLLTKLQTISTADETPDTSPNVSPAAIHPSPIQEEPKIRRLPPPWI